MKTKKTITAGPLVKEAIYPRGSAHDSPKIRAAKRKLSSAAQQRMNAKYMKEKLEMQLAANFLPRDLWVTLTFRPEDLPETEQGVDACMKAFLRRLRKARGKKTAPVVYWRAEHKHESDDVLQHQRWHVHCCITAAGQDYDQIRSCWIYGDNVEIEPLKVDRENSYAKLAEYMTKEPLDRPGAHAWHNTRNAKKPEVEITQVPDDTPLNPPRGTIVYETASASNEYGSFRYVKYLYVAALRNDRVPRARRRR